MATGGAPPLGLGRLGQHQQHGGRAVEVGDAPGVDLPEDVRGHHAAEHHVGGAGTDSDERICNTTAAIIVGVNTDFAFDILTNMLHDFFKLPWKRTTIGIAQHNTICSCLVCHLDGHQCILRIGFEPVKEVLCIVDNFFAH